MFILSVQWKYQYSLLDDNSVVYPNRVADCFHSKHTFWDCMWETESHTEAALIQTLDIFFTLYFIHSFTENSFIFT